MTIPDPPWKQKTRPCPFYSQGRCLFSDSCNFLHDVKIKVKNPEIAIITSPTPESTPALSRSNSITSSPTSSSSALRVRSPPRSPRISSLLLALGDAIEPDAEEEALDEDVEDVEDTTTRFVPPNAVLGQVTRQRGGGSIAGDDPVAHTLENVEASSPPQAAPTPDDPVTTPPRPSATHVRNTSGQRSVPSELMSPVELTLAPPYYHPITGLPQAQHRDSVDSGFGDNWTGPVPFALSPPNNRSSRRYSTLSLLSSPFGSPARALSPKVGPSSSPLLARYSRHSSQGSAVENAREDSLDELDSPTDYARKRESFISDRPLEPLDALEPLEPSEPLEPTRPLEAEPVSGQLDVGYVAQPPVAPSLQESDPDAPPSPTQDKHEQESITTSLEPLETQHPTWSQNAELTIRPSAVSTLQDVHDVSSNVFADTADTVARQRDSVAISSPHQPSNPEYTVRPPSAPSLDPGPTSENEATPSYFAPGTPPEETSSPIVFIPAPSTSPPTKRGSMSPAFHVPFFSPISRGTPLSPVFSVPSSSHSTAHPLDRPGTPKSPSTDEHDADDSAGDETQLYGSYYEEIPVAETSYYSTPQMQHAVLKRTSTSGSSRRSRVFSPPPPVSPPTSIASGSSLSILKPPVAHRESLAKADASGLSNPSFAGAVSPRIAIVDAAETDAYHDQDWSPLGQEIEIPDSRRNSRSMSSAPSRESISSGQFSNVPQSPFEPRPASATDFNAEARQERRSSKVPFGFRHSLAARSRDSLLPSRPGSAPLVRHRPPALIGIGSIRSNSLNNNPRPDLSSPTESLPSASRLRPLRLSALYSATSLSFSSGISPSSSAQFPPINSATTPATSQPSSPSVTSECSLSNNQLLSPARASSIPLNSVDHTLIPSDSSSSDAFDQPVSHASSASLASKHMSWTNPISPANGLPPHRLEHLIRPSSRASEPIQVIPEDETIDFDDMYEPSHAEAVGDTIRAEAVTSAPPYTRPPSSASLAHEPVHAIATPRPTLLFAIASDNVEEVRRVLESGEASANDNAAGPQSPLTFALTATQLKHRKDIVKLLLAHGANTSSLNLPEGGSQRASMSSSQMDAQDAAAREDVLASVDPATRYYIARADAPQTRRASALIHRSFFRPLTKVRYDLIGQDRALEQLFRVLSMPTMAPIVVLFCGPSGHGKSLLARRFGSLLDVPTHTVNMTTLRSTRDIWRSYSMSPYEESSDSTLADFLMENERKRCVVVLDEIEKTENETILSSLLMPWELGRVSFEAGHRHVDCSKVIWLGTSNIGHDLVFEHQATRLAPKDAMTRDEYVDLMRMLRPRVSDRLGPSLLSRVTTVLPFVPFTVEEQMAIASEALFSLSEDATSTLPGATVEKLVKDSLHSYVPAEGARSLYRAVSTQLLDTL